MVALELLYQRADPVTSRFIVSDNYLLDKQSLGKTGKAARVLSRPLYIFLLTLA